MSKPARRKTKTQRLQAIVNEYNRRFPGPFEMEAVAEWAMEHRLWPTPGRLTREVSAAEEWDRRFALLEAEQPNTTRGPADPSTS